MGFSLLIDSETDWTWLRHIPRGLYFHRFQRVRIISARLATTTERHVYEEGS
jgi:uncharacterized DUF497 family protein